MGQPRKPCSSDEQGTSHVDSEYLCSGADSQMSQITRVAENECPLPDSSCHCPTRRLPYAPNRLQSTATESTLPTNKHVSPLFLLLAGLLLFPSIISFIYAPEPHSPAKEKHEFSLTTATADSTGDERSFPVDAVFTWVDPHDLKWRQDKAMVGEEEEVRAPTAPCGNYSELYFALHGAVKHMQFLRQVFIVTQRPQTPNLSGLKKWNPFLTFHIVHHDEFIPARYLPTYNSICIESWLHQIPGLSEHFIYLNDDFIVASPVHASQFFTESGKPIIARQTVDTGLRWPWLETMFLNQQRHWGKKLGHRLNAYDHVPYAFRREKFLAFHDAYSDAIAATCENKIRDPHDYSIPVLMATLNPHDIHYVPTFPFSHSAVHRGSRVPSSSTTMCFNNIGSGTPKWFIRASYIVMTFHVLSEHEYEEFRTTCLQGEMY